jgi:Type II intron maturase
MRRRLVSSCLWFHDHHPLQTQYSSVRRRLPHHGRCSCFISSSSSHSKSSHSSTFQQQQQHPPENTTIIQVERVDMVGLNNSPMKQQEVENNPSNRPPALLVLTHAHDVSDAVLRRQLHLHNHTNSDIPTVAVELTRSLTASSLDGFYMILSEYLLLHKDLPRSFCLTGLPKSGKSSLALLAARRRRLAVKRPGGSKNKFDYSLMLPQPNVTWQAYQMEAESKLPDMRPMTIWDPPSTTEIDSDTVYDEPLRTILRAAGCLPALPTTKRNSNNDEDSINDEMEILQILLDAIHRHAQVSSATTRENHPFPGSTKRAVDNITTASDFWDHIIRQQQQQRTHNDRKNKSAITTLPQLIRACREGRYGPLLFGDHDDDDEAGMDTTIRPDHDLCTIHRGKAVVACNAAALALLNRATSANKAQSTSTTSSKKGQRGKIKGQKHDSNHTTTDTPAAAAAVTTETSAAVLEPPGRPVPPPFEPSSEETVRPATKTKEKDTMDELPVIRFPLHRRSFSCMVCAGFVKRGPDQLVYGCGHTKILSRRYEQIIAYFSRMTEAFGETRRIQYLMKDSLACTLMRKHKLRSRAAAYKKFHGIREFPMPNRLRPIFLRSDKPIPFVPICSRLGNSGKLSCYDTYAAKLLDTIPNYEARVNVLAMEQEQLLDDLQDNDDSDDD